MLAKFIRNKATVFRQRLQSKEYLLDCDLYENALTFFSHNHMTLYPKISLLLLCVFLIGVQAGCNNNVQVSGKISFDDGTPIPGANVIFISGITQGKGTTNAEGIYTLSFEKENDGIPPGSYQVLIAGAFFKPDNVVIREHEKDLDTGMRPMIDITYAETETSPLTCEVPGGSYDFVVQPSDTYKQSKGIQ